MSVLSEACDLVASMQESIGTLGDPYHSAVLVCLAVVILTFVAATLTANYSQVDKLWSIVPVVYAWLPVCDARTLVMACLATVWGIRLTWNFSRRGGYKWPPWDGDEDYRWEVIRTGGFLKILTDPIVWAIFNFGFISLYQNVLLLLITAPSFVAYTLATSPYCQSAPLNAMDVMAAMLFLLFVIIESVGDNQQYAFQKEKYRRKNNGEPLTGDYKDGFCQSGLFAIVRKPMYAAEQAIWVCFYLFSVAAAGKPNWSCIGCLLLMSLFQVSGWFTEKITLGKYPKYAQYQKQVPLYVPNPFGRRTIKHD